jgi:glycine/D-amino acid oxidase-like deaminating enzyme
MTTEYGVFSGWVDPPDDPGEPLDRDLQCDVTVVGGGYTGVAAALQLAERGVDTVLLEADFCGWGASSRNAGHLTTTIAGDPQLLATVYRRRLPELVRFADSAAHHTEDLIERLGIECDYEPVGNVSAALSAGQLRRAERIARTIERAGGEVELVEGRAFGLPGRFLGGIHEKIGGVLNPGRLMRGLREALLRSPVRVHERTAVRAVEPGPGAIELRTPAARVRADRVVLATNAFSRDLPFAPPRIVRPVWVTLAETEPFDPSRLSEAGWTSRAGIYTQHLILESFRPTRRGTIVFGTRQVQAPGRGALAPRRPDSAIVDDVVRGFRDRLPSLSDVSVQRAWGGWIAMTPSWLPVAGEATANVFYAVGYNGHGLAQAPYVGTLLADRLVDGEPHEHLGTIWRPTPRFAPAPLFSAPALKAGWALDRLWDRLAIT